MAVDPRLMMVDYQGGLGRAGEAIGKGIQAYKMNQVNDLAGKAMMLDPAAMEELKERNPMMAVQIQQKQAEQAATQKQRQMEMEKLERQKMDWGSGQLERYGKIFSRSKSIDEARELHNRLLQTDPVYKFLHDGDPEQGEEGVGGFGEDDLLNARAMYGSGFGDMDLKDLVRLYQDNPVVKDALSAKNGIESIKRNYETFLKNPTKSQASGFGVAKTAIQLVESGVVRPEEFAAAAGIALPGGLDAGGIMNFLETKIRGGLTPEQINGLARLGIDAYNSKVKNVLDLQSSMTKAGLGQHMPESVFSTGQVDYIDDFTIPVQETAQTPKPIQWQSPDGKAYTFPNKEALNQYLDATGGR